MSTIVITGCSTGFGFQAAKMFAARGDKVFATMRNVAGKNKEAADKLIAEGNGIEVVELDVTSDASVDAAVAIILEKGGAPDVVINNAGQMYVGLTEAFTAAELSKQLDINVVGIHRVTRAFLPAMRTQVSGLIINVSSIAGRFGAPFFGVYHASKWAVEGYSQGLRRELARTGVDLVVVEPGPFTTELFGQSPQPKDADGRAQSYPAVTQETFEALGKAFEGMFEDPNVPTDPIDVVNAFVNLVDMAPGERPFRTVVGVDLGVIERNKSDEVLDGPFLQAMGLEEFSQLKTS
jgi:NAD(P)-dependent dehydrogenase (short-subunit alcohol dehydrogenase family)